MMTDNNECIRMFYGEERTFDLLHCHLFSGCNGIGDLLTRQARNLTIVWLVGCFGFNGHLKYFNLYRAVSQREGERKEK